MRFLALAPIAAACASLATSALIAGQAGTGTASYEVRKWADCANGGDAGCQYNLGRFYVDGKDPPDQATGVMLLSKSAGRGNLPARNKLGLLYMRGQVVTKDYRRAREYFDSAAKNGYAAAQANIGLMYLRGYGVPVDLEEAFAWSDIAVPRLESAARQRDEILPLLSPEQWSRGRERARKLAAAYAPGRSVWSSIGRLLDTYAPYVELTVVLCLPIVMLVGWVARKRKERKLKAHRMIAS